MAQIPSNNYISNPTSVSKLNINIRTKGFKSPASWRDQVLYFLLPDRFSDGLETTKNRPLFDINNPSLYRTNNRPKWITAGKEFQGGTIKGITSKLSYLQNLGVTTIWIGPIWQQRIDQNDSYHGYAIQNFLNVDPRFGTIADLIELIEQAHQRSIYILLDVIYNHTGDNWFYYKDGQFYNKLPYRHHPKYDFGAWRSQDGLPTATINSLLDGVWPIELQNPEWYSRHGKIERWDPEPWEDPLHPDCQFRKGDFINLKSFDYQYEELLNVMIRIFQYWIGLTDCDGFRIDTVKHLPWDVSRIFCGAIHEYAESIGKDNFLLLGEVCGGSEMIKNYLEIFGRNIDASLDIGEPAERLEKMIKGIGDPKLFFEQFSEKDILGSHRDTGRYHVSILDDHDRVGRHKCRFATGITSPYRYLQTAHAVGVQLTTLGIPCIYYGTEQAFDGTVDQHDYSVQGFEPDGELLYADRYIRESMFGSEFGAFETSGCHFFNPEHPTYLRIAAICKIRQQNNKVGLALRRGRQYFRETSVLGKPFSYPNANELVAWSRILVDKEVVIALNTNNEAERGAEITIHAPFYQTNNSLIILYDGSWSDDRLKYPEKYPPESIPVKRHPDGRVTVSLVLPPAGMVILG